MITNVPTRQEFEEQGLTLLNLAWDTVTDLLIDYRDAEDWDGIVEEEQTEHYLKAAQKPLAISTALLQQGAEFLVKAAIADVSPYLLIAGNAPAWPKRCNKADTQFSAFRTADAEDLIRIHDTVATSRFSTEFVQTFTQMRHIRNTVFHSVDRNLRFSDKQIIQSILIIADELLEPNTWFKKRNAYLDSVPSAAWACTGNGFRLSREFDAISDLLSTAELKRYFDFNRRRRRYICPSCKRDCLEVSSDFTPLTAQLVPNSPGARNVLCVVCRQQFPVRRSSCQESDCPGNVIHVGEFSDNECLTCFSNNFE